GRTRQAALLEARRRAAAFCDQRQSRVHDHQETRQGSRQARLMSARLERLRGAFDRHGIDGVVISQPESRYYLSGYSGHDLPPRDSAGYLLITSSEALLLTDARTTEQAEREASDFDVRGYGSGARGPEAIASTANRLGIRRLGFESIHLPH